MKESLFTHWCGMTPIRMKSGKDSSYYYFRELAKMGGWNAELAYSYWGGTGIAHYSGLVKGCEERAAQCEKLINGNEYYDYFIVAGNSNEAVETYSGEVGAIDYRQRPQMLRGAELLHEKIQGKAGRMLLWAPHAYQYGFLRGMAPKPWKLGTTGDIYVKDGQEFVLTLTSREMAESNARWYGYMAKELGEDTGVLHKFNTLLSCKIILHWNVAHQLMSVIVCVDTHGKLSCNHGHLSSSGSGDIGIAQPLGGIGRIRAVVGAAKAHLTRNYSSIVFLVTPRISTISPILNRLLSCFFM